MAPRLYGLFWRWHFAIGLIACPLVAVVALTGALYTFEPELDRWADADVRMVEPGGQPRPLDELAAAAATRCQVGGAELPGRPDVSYLFHCRDERPVHVDPYRGAVLGEPSSITQEVMEVAFALHWELMLGERGRVLIEWATSWTLVLLASGAILWWPRGKRRTGGVLWPRTRLRGRLWLRDLHAVSGAYALPVVLALAATGLMWTLHAGDGRWNKIAGEAAHEHPRSRVVPGAPRIGLDAAFAGAKLALDDRGIYIGIPGGDDPADRPYEIYLNHNAHEAPSKIERILVDAYSGQELHREGWKDRSALGKVDAARYSIHVGAILGLPGRIAACLASLILAGLCITGPWMWWKRRAPGGLAAPPASPVPWWIYLLVAALGWILPTVGLTLLFVAAIEIVRRLIARSRTTLKVT